MNETRILAKQFIGAIVKDLSSLNGTQFEDLCEVLLRLILNDDVLHKGCNLNGKPVPYAVDVKTEDCKIVGQSGTDTDYFTKNDLEKPISDIKGTKNNNPLCELLYLFSNQRATDAQHTNLRAKINEESLSFEVKIYDAEKIAKTIYKNVDNPRCNDAWQFLSQGKQYYEIFPKKNCIPQSSAHYVVRLPEEKELLAILDNNPFVEIVGVSGIGKSEFAKQVAKDISQRFDAIFWIDGNDCKSLDSVKLCQFAYDVNLRFVLQNYKCLVIVDNLNENVSQFQDEYNAANKHESKCVITTLKQHLTNEQTYRLPYMLKSLVRNVIDSFGLSITEADKDRILQLTAGYPLAVIMVCSLIKYDDISMEDLLEESRLQELEDEHNKRLSERIIGKIYERYKESLNLLAYIDCLTIASDYLESAISKIPLTYFCKYSILQRSDAYSYRIHQIVLDAIKYIYHQQKTQYSADKLIEYLDKKNSLKDIHFFTLFHYNGSYIEKVYQESATTEEQKKIILYSQLQAESTFGNPKKYLDQLNTLSLNPADSLYDCLLLADKDEIELFATARDEFEDKAKSMIANVNKIMDHAANTKIKFEALHHIGKLYMKLEGYDNAKEQFGRALAIRPKAYATLFQLAKAYHKSRPSDTKKVKEYVSAIMDDFGKGEFVPLTIILACYSDFLSKKVYQELRKKYIEDKIEEFSKVIMQSLVSFDNQAVPTLGSLIFSLAYTNPDFTRLALQALQEPPSKDSDKAYIQAYANIKAVEYKLEKDKESYKARAIFASAKEYYGLLKLQENEGYFKKDYLRKRYLELLMDAGELYEALEFSNCFDDKESAFFLQDMAKLYQMYKEYDRALECIDKAIAKNEDEGYKSSFMWNKANILYEKGDKSCLSLLRDAIEMRKDDKAKKEWKETLKKWSNEFNLQDKNNV